MVKKLIKNKIFILLLTIVVIYNSGYALSVIDTNKYLLLFSCIPVVFIAVLTTIRINRFTLKQVILFLLICMVFLSYLINGLNDSINYYYLISIILLSFFITSFYSFKSFRLCFNNIMFIVSIISLLFYYYNNYISLLDLPILSNINNVDYGVAYIFFYIIIVPKRNCGIFWEPGLFATFLIISLLFNTIDDNIKLKKTRMFIYILTIITTFSSAGYLLLLLYFVFLLFYYKKNKFTNILFFIICLLILFIIYLNFDSIMKCLPDDIFYSLNRLSFENVSNESRFKAISDNLSIFFNSYGLGVGFGKYVLLSNYVSDTATVLYFIAVFGLLGIQYIIYWIISIFKIKNINIFSKILLFIIIFFILNKEPHVFICVTWIILFYLLDSNNKETIKHDSKKRT